jgi:hypothetical protein
MFYVINSVILPDPLATFFGRGPGTVTEYFARFSFVAHGGTWGKLIYEGGFLGFLAFISFYGSAVFGKSNPFVLPVTLLYFFLGGYLLDPSIIAIVVSLVVWLPGGEESPGPGPNSEATLRAP